MSGKGFTLVEMLVALTLFAMLTAAGVTLLGVTARTQETADRQLQRQGALRSLGALLAADLAQAAARPHRNVDGEKIAALTGGDNEAGLLLFVRRGWDAGEGTEPRRIGYRLRAGQLERLSFAHLDGDSSALAVPVLHKVKSARLRFRHPDGEWRDRWDPTDPLLLPSAVELVTTSEDHGVVRQLFLVGLGRL